MSRTTKMLLVAISLPSGRLRTEDFLVPLCREEGEVQFVGIRSGKPASYGLLVYTGVAVSSFDLHERVAESLGAGTADGHAPLLDRYLNDLQGFRIGNVLTIRSCATAGFRLEKIAERPPPFAPHPKLPG